MDEIVMATQGALGRLSLNRPRALNALNRAMCDELGAGLAQLVGAEAIRTILIDHAEGRGFCAGGDIAAMRQSALADGGAAARAFFLAEYRLNHQLFTCGKPVVAVMDGITMGGGVGLALPAQLRIATEHTRFAMPEGAIGLFPDVGAGWFLPRLPRRVGHYLALTGARIDGADCLWAGLATHYLPAAALPDARARMAAGEAPRSVLDDLAIAPPPSRLAAEAPLIERAFAHERVEDILAALAADSGEWAEATRAALLASCPMTLKVALRQFARGLAATDFAHHMAMEYRLACRMVLRPDFAEGVRAVIVDKDRAPRWQPAHAADLPDAAVEALFAPLPADEEWTPR